jgi:hypothetical protein
MNSSLNLYDLGTDKGKEVGDVLAGVVTTYIPIYMGNQLLFWSGRYWEEFHPVISTRIKSKDLIDENLENGVLALAVFIPFFDETCMLSKLGHRRNTRIITPKALR